MKKRLLITSIVMMLVVAVALGTSTYAWFTSNATVKANEITLKATTSTAPALGISWTDGNYGTEITPVITAWTSENGFAFSPVAPLTLYNQAAVDLSNEDDITTVTLSNVDFLTSTTYSSGGDFKFGANGAAAPAQSTYVVTDGTGEGKGHTSFFLKNLSGTNALTGTLRMSATITGTGANLMRVGVFKKNTTSGNYELLDVLANDTYTYTAVAVDTPLTNGDAGSYYKKVNGQYVPAVAGTAQEVTNGTADYYIGDTENSNAGATTAPAGKFFTRDANNGRAKAVYGEIVKNASVNAMPSIDCVTSIDLGTNLPHDTVIELKVIVWMDAAALGDAEQGLVGSIILNFTVA